MKKYGTTLTLDVTGCNVDSLATEFRKESLIKFFEMLCSLLEMERMDLHFWDDLGDEDLPDPENINPKTWGIFAVQFIKTGSITIHALPYLNVVFVDIFSCKDFDVSEATDFIENWFQGRAQITFQNRYC